MNYGNNATVSDGILGIGRYIGITRRSGYATSSSIFIINT